MKLTHRKRHRPNPAPKHRAKHPNHHPRHRRRRRPVLPPPAQPPKPAPKPTSGGPAPVAGGFGRREAERLLWRAGFGPRPGDVDRVAALGLNGAVQALTRPSGSAVLTGPEPRDDDGVALAPADQWGHDHLWWLDRMVRSDQSLVERMALVWHDWFATSNEKVGSQQRMLDQNDLFRRQGLGSFHDLLLAVTQDPAMLTWLDGIDNSADDPNENYAREVMELFTLGADRGAYTETDVREAARAFTGFRATWVDGAGLQDFRFDDGRHDHGSKTIFGKTGDFDWRDACRLCVENPYHASFFVTKLWSYFIPTPPDAATQAALQRAYLESGYGIQPVVEAILKHPDLYSSRVLVKPPVVFNAGLLRMVGRAIDTTAWAWLGDLAGQMLFHPPNVAGWDDSSWLDTSTWRGRADIATYAFRDSAIDPWGSTPYSATEDPATAVSAALGFLGEPTLGSEVRDGLLSFATRCLPAIMANWEQAPYRAMRQNALRHLIVTSSDWQTS